MCGRYITAQAAAIERAIRLGKISWRFEPSYNVAPTQQVPVVRPVVPSRQEGSGADADLALAASGAGDPTNTAPPGRASDGPEGLTLRWGLIPFFAKGVPPKYSTINATIEKLQSGPVWRGPWSRGQRCLMPAAGFYEWHLDESGKKVPYFIQLADQEIFTFAAIWDRSYKEDGTAVESCAIITMPGNELMRQVHNTGANPYRMPAILAREDQEVWLYGKKEQAWGVLKQYAPDVMVTWPVSLRVNSPKNNDDKLILPVEPDRD